MANKGPKHNGSQFFITLDSMRYLDGDYTIFGRVKKNTQLVDLMAAQGTPSGLPKSNVVLKHSGVYMFEKKKTHTLIDPTIRITPKGDAKK